MKAVVSRIIPFNGAEYRLVASEEAPDMPDELKQILVKQKYVEEPPAEKQAAFKLRKTKEGEVNDNGITTT